ncbi:hypothetical protein ACLI4U_02125 [Natrialbaceae archaeon A-CW2]|uniref:hypothetical protein n=1 Tax=Natronosalvus amylolyticus TaxID=2961994 RepID=UPI0020C9D3FD|nr:hypothetical protein [Natronosalvus amylolyticus]
MSEPFTLLLDDCASIVLEKALTEYRNDEIMELNPDSDEEQRARQLHNRLRQSHSLGAGSTVPITTDAEAQTVLNSLSYYNVDHKAKHRVSAVEKLTAVLFDHSGAALFDVPIITDFLEEEEMQIQPDDLEEHPTDPSNKQEVEVGVKTGVDREEDDMY